jgi:hypothetical protein
MHETMHTVGTRNAKINGVRRLLDMGDLDGVLVVVVSEVRCSSSGSGLFLQVVC